MSDRKCCSRCGTSEGELIIEQKYICKDDGSGNLGEKSGEEIVTCVKCREKDEMMYGKIW